MSMGSKKWNRMGMMVWTACLSLFVVGAPSEGQFRGGFGDPFEPGVNSRELEQFAELLGLSEDQKLVIETMFEGYQREFEAASQVARRAMDEAREEFRDTRDPAVWQDIRGVMEELGAKREAMDRTFLDDVKLLLTPDQSDKWPELERTRRRTRTLSRGFLSGEGVDLFRIARDLKVTEDAEAAASVEAVLERYAIDLDRALQKRNELYESGMRDAMDMWRGGNFEEMQKRFEEARDAGVAVRDINRRYARQIESLLGDEERAAFSHEFKRQSFPRVYRRTYGMRVVESVDEFDDLTVDQRASIAAARERFERERSSLEDRWAAAIESGEMNRSVRDMFGMGGGDQEVRTLRNERRALDEKFVEQVRAVLTPEQVSRLPEGGAEDDDQDAGPPRRGFGERRGPRGNGGGREREQSV